MVKIECKKKKGYEVFAYYQEKLIKFSDIDNKSITNERAKEVLARVMKLPMWLGAITLNDMELLGYIKRISREKIAIINKD